MLWCSKTKQSQGVNKRLRTITFYFVIFRKQLRNPTQKQTAYKTTFHITVPFLIAVPFLNTVPSQKTWSNYAFFYYSAFSKLVTTAVLYAQNKCNRTIDSIIVLLCVLYLFLYHLLEGIEGADGSHVLRRRQVGHPAASLRTSSLSIFLLHDVHFRKHLQKRKNGDLVGALLSGSAGVTLVLFLASQRTATVVS